MRLFNLITVFIILSVFVLLTAIPVAIYFFLQIGVVYNWSKLTKLMESFAKSVKNKES